MRWTNELLLILGLKAVHHEIEYRNCRLLRCKDVYTVRQMTGT
jgi:hypothetical protein